MISEADNQINLTVHHHGRPIQFEFPSSPPPTIADLSSRIATTLSIPSSNQKLMITPRIGLIKPTAQSENELQLSNLLSCKIALMGSTTTEVFSLNSTIASLTRAASRPRMKQVTPSRVTDRKRVQEESLYTFTTLRAHPNLPDPPASLALLGRLRDDAGIKACMRKHHWTVPLLTEMDPAQYTDHQGKTLGLNRNQGEVIELRLRTDSGDGYRDYKGIRRTLCHELTHNVWQDHDRRFWDMCKALEQEVEQADWKSGGRKVSNEEFYEPEEDHSLVDDGGWTGGEYVLGSTGAPNRSSGSQPLSRREILAQAAETRMRKQNEASRNAKDERQEDP